MRRRLALTIVLVLVPVIALELVFVPVDRVLASPPNAPLTSCSSAQPGTSTGPTCGFTASYFAGGGSLTYCFLGEGALYLRGVYYPLTQPSASPAREISNRYCPAMHK